MREILDFFKDIFIIKEEESFNIGLSILKQKKEKPIKHITNQKKKEVRLSELMRGQVS